MARRLSSRWIRRLERTFRPRLGEATARSGAGAAGPGDRRDDRGPEGAKKKLGGLRVTQELRDRVRREIEAWNGKLRLTRLLTHLGVSTSTWYRLPKGGSEPRGRPRDPLDPVRVEAVRDLCRRYPFWGYKRIAVVARRDVGPGYSDRLTYRIMRELNLLQKRAPRRAELHQTRHLFELLPSRPNDLWQMDVTYLHLPQGHWWYAVTVIDYYSRYLLACHLTPFQNAGSVAVALDLARAEAERFHGPLDREPTLVTDNGSCFLARKFQKHIEERFSHVRIQYRTPQQLGLLERFHSTLKKEEVYWRMYDGPNHARQCLEEFRDRYNRVRPHWALRPSEKEDPLTPADVYEDGLAVVIPKWQKWARAAKKKLEEAAMERKAA